MKRFDAGAQDEILDYGLKTKIDAIIFYVNLYYLYEAEISFIKKNKGVTHQTKGEKKNTFFGVKIVTLSPKNGRFLLGSLIVRRSPWLDPSSHALVPLYSASLSTINHE